MKKKRRRWPWIVAIAAIFIIGLASMHSQSNTPVVAGPTPTGVATQQSSIPTGQPTLAPTAQPAVHPTAKPTATPSPVVLHPTPTPRPATPTPCPDPCNPFGYNFTPGNQITNPPSNFCDYFACISTFWNGNGYVNECQDASYSKSGGIQGDCSHHGGYWRTLYSH